MSRPRLVAKLGVVGLVLVVLSVLVLATSIALVSAVPAPGTLNPNAAGSATNLNLTGAASNWEACSTSDGETSYVSWTTSGTAWNDDLYALSDPGLTGTINSVTVYMEAARDDYAGIKQDGAKTAIMTHSTTYYGTPVELARYSTTGYVTYSTTYDTNPNTTSAWTWDEVNDLEAGVSLRSSGSGSASVMSRCTHVWVVVTYNKIALNPNVAGDETSLNVSTTTDTRVPTSDYSYSNFGATTSDTRVPTADGDISGTWNASSGERWDCVNETPPADDSDYMTGTNGGYCLFTFTAFDVPAGSTINSLTVYIRARDQAFGESNTVERIKVNGSYYDGSSENPSSSSWTTYSYSWTTNPDTGSAWTAADINGTGSNPLQQIGVSSDGDPDTRISMVYAEVTYLTTPLYDQVDETSPGDADYITGSGVDGYAVFGFSAFNVSSDVTVTELTIYYRAKNESSGSNNIRARIVVGGTSYNQGSEDPTTSWNTYSYTWATNPATLAAWTVTEINGTDPTNPLQNFGVYSNDLDPTVQVSMVYAEVTYIANWEACSTSDDDSSYVTNTTEGSTGYDLYNLDDHGTATGLINSVTVYVVAKRSSSGTATAQPVIKTGGTEYRPGTNDLTTSYVDYSYTWATNPETSAAWTWTDIDALQAGVELYTSSGSGTRWSRCTHVWVVVDYTPIPQYYLTVTSPYGTTGGEGLYDSGDNAQATVTPLIVDGGNGVQYVFTHWSGDATGVTSPSDSITMDAPKTATANWVEIENSDNVAGWDNYGIGFAAAGSHVTANFDNVYFENIDFDAKANIQNAQIIVEQLVDRPSDISIGPADSPYGYVRVILINLNENDIENIVLTFKVEKSWIAANSIDESNMTLNRWNSTDNTWAAYSATKVGEDDNYSYFSVNLPGLSTFVIGGSVIATTPTLPTSPSVTPPLSPPTLPPALTAAFVLQSLIINPTQASVGEVVGISVSVMNTGSGEGTYLAELRINGALIDIKIVKLKAGLNGVVTFYFTPESDGTYSVEIGGLTGSFSVVTPPTVIPLSASLIFLIAIIATGALVGAVVVRRRYF